MLTTICQKARVVIRQGLMLPHLVEIQFRARVFTTSNIPSTIHAHVAGVHRQPSVLAFSSRPIVPTVHILEQLILNPLLRIRFLTMPGIDKQDHTRSRNGKMQTPQLLLQLHQPPGHSVIRS